MGKRSSSSILIEFALVALSSGRAAEAQLLRERVNGNLKPIPGAKTWGRTPDKDVSLPLRYRARVRPTELIVGRDHPNGTRLLALFPRSKLEFTGVELPVNFAKGFQGFDDYGDLKPGYTVEVVQRDFSHRGAPEILVAVGDGRTELALNIVQYHAPKLARNAGSPKNWSVIGSFSGQTSAEIQGGVIQIPTGSQGRRKTYQWIKGKFLEIGAGTAGKLR